MDAVRCDDDVSRGASTIRKREESMILILLEADAPVAGAHNSSWQPVNEHCEQVGAVHPVEFDVARQLRGPHRRGVGSIGPTKLRVDLPGAPAGQPLSETEPPQHPYPIRLDRDAGANLGHGRGLLIEADVHAALEQSGGGGDATNAAANNCHS
jgi:hypothetical protein